MAERDQQLDVTKKRGRSELSSTSELDSSINTPPTKKNSKKKNKTDKTDNPELLSIQNELKQINKKMSNVMTKDDGNLRELIKEIIKQMKDELTKSTEKKIEVLEGKLFQKEEENDTLKKKVEKLEEVIETQCNENESLKIEMEINQRKTAMVLNDHEQYSRVNNIRINGLTEDVDAKGNASDNAYKTTRTVVKELNKYIPNLKITDYDIDIAHRIGKAVKGRKRQVIVRFTSRLVKEMVMKNIKKFKGSGLFIAEDLTGLNHVVLNSVKKKMPDEVSAAWYTKGKICYENKTGTAHVVKFEEYEQWINLPWPKLGENKKHNQPGAKGN